MTGDLNIVQQYCLSWALLDEREDQIILEKERMKYTILAGNTDLYRQMYAEQDQQQQLTTLQEEEWKSMEQVDESQMDYIFSEIERWQTQREE